jgi:hypothetical protein
MGHAVEAGPERIRHHLRRPVPGRRYLLTQPPETPLVRQTRIFVRGWKCVRLQMRAQIIPIRAVGGSWPEGSRHGPSGHYVSPERCGDAACVRLRLCGAGGSFRVGLG